MNDPEYLRQFMIDWSKPVRTRDGREVQIWTTEAKSSQVFPVRGEILRANGTWEIHEWEDTGASSLNNGQLDLVNVVPQKHTKTYWLVHYPGCTVVHTYKPRRVHAAIAITGPHTIEFEEGEGLETP